MKKLLSLTLAIIVVLSLAVPAMADEVNKGTESKDVTITTNVGASYTVVIPSNLNVATANKTANDFGSIYLKSAVLNPDSYVTVSASGTGNLVNQNATNPTETDKIAYTIKKGEDTFTSVQLSAVGTENDNKLTVTFDSDDVDAATAGTYSATVTFNVAYTDGSKK